MTSIFSRHAVLSTLLLVSGLAWSQASAPVGPGYGAGFQARQMGGARGGAGPNITPGWALMTPAERTEHRAAMAAAKTYDECVLIQSRQREQLAARAKERGVAAPTPRRDTCASMKR